ncbi:MAG: serine protease [Actinomycetota bacterium]
MTPSPVPTGPNPAPRRGRRAAPAISIALVAFAVLGVLAAPAGAIVNGREADAAEHPWQVALVDDSGSVFCGGALATPDRVVTAAHCVEEGDPGDIVARVGVADLDRDTGQQRRGESVTIHPDYERDGVVDLAVLELDRPVRLTDGVATIAPAGPADRAAATTGTVAGWGVLSEEDESDVRRLRSVDVPVWDDDRCATEMDADPDAELCAGGERAGSCYGDSGGPLVVSGGSDSPRLTGVVSWGDRCGDDTPGVYTDVTEHRAWLDDVLADRPPSEGATDPEGGGDDADAGDDEATGDDVTGGRANPIAAWYLAWAYGLVD